MATPALLADDHPLIRACNNRYGIDLAQNSEDGTFAIRSANMTAMPEFYDAKVPRPRKSWAGAQRPPNFFVDAERTRLCIALSPQNVCELFQLATKQDAIKAITQAFHAFPESTTIPIRVQSRHVLWGEPVTITRDKMEFRVCAREEEDEGAAPAPDADRFSAKRCRGAHDAPAHDAPVHDAPAPAAPRPHAKVTYNGMTYDDDDEARHAFLMDCLDVKYRTQPINIQHPLLINETNRTGLYRTDFYVPSLDAYLETTGSEPSARKHFTCELLARHAFHEGRTVYLVYGGLHPPRRDTYSADGTQTMKIIKYVVEAHTFANGREELVVVAEDGYAWMHKNGAYVIDKLGSVMNRAWDHPHLRAAVVMARTKVF